MKSLLNDLSKIKIKSDQMYFLSPFGLGDTAVLCGLLPVLQKRLASPIKLIIKKSHIPIMKMYGCDNYDVISDQRFYPDSPELIDLANQQPFPQLGKIFVAHYCLYPINDLIRIQEIKHNFSMLDSYLCFFNLPWSTKLTNPENEINFIKEKKDEVLNKVAKLIGVKSDIVLLIPEAHTFKLANFKIWPMIIESVKSRGLIPITSVTSESCRIKNVQNLELELDELITLAMCAKEVYAVRSGLCDLIWPKGKSLTAIYPDIDSYYFGRLKSLFPSSNVNEIVVG